MRNESACHVIDYEEFAKDRGKKDSQSSILGQPAIGKIINGTSASFGVAEGPATVLSDPYNLYAITQIRKGALLVCRIAPPDIVMIVPILNALVVESGGILAATPQFARECSVPAVIGADDATKIIKDGDIIRVDGTKGIVEIIETEKRRRA